MWDLLQHFLVGSQNVSRVVMSSPSGSVTAGSDTVSPGGIKQHYGISWQHENKHLYLLLLMDAELTEVKLCFHPARLRFPEQAYWFPVLPHQLPRREGLRKGSSFRALFQTAASVSSGSELAPWNEKRSQIRSLFSHRALLAFTSVKTRLFVSQTCVNLYSLMILFTQGKIWNASTTIVT